MSEQKKSKAKFWALVAVSACAAFVAGSYAAYRAYRHWMPSRVAARASSFLARGDFQNAVLTARRVLEMNPNNLEATRVMALASERANVVEAVQWRQRLVQLDPTTANRLAWAQAALRFNQANVAEEALASIQEFDRNTVDYQTAAGTAAMLLGKVNEAAEHFKAALKIAPKNEMCRFNDAVVEMQSHNPEKQKAAIATMEELAWTEKYRALALRALVSHFVNAKQFEAALSRARELADDPKSTFRDHLQLLDLLHRTKNSDAASYAKKLREEAGEKPEEMSLMMTWLNSNGAAEESIAWAQTLKPEIAANPYVGSALAEALSFSKKWNELRDFLKDKNWGDAEYMRLVYYALALKELGDSSGFHAQWDAAVSATLKRPDVVGAVVKTVMAWGWEDETRELLWRIAQGSREPKAALLLLNNYYMNKNDTRGLQRVVSRLVELEPNNDNAKNNLAMFSLLLNSNRARAFEIAQELYNKQPTNASFASTYALALFLQEKKDEALRVMNALSEEQLRDPQVAAYYAMILKANDESEKAAIYAPLAKNAKLLPEEIELIRQSSAPKNSP